MQQRARSYLSLLRLTPTNDTASTSDGPSGRLSKWLTNRRAAAIIAVAGVLTYVTGLASPFWNDDNGQIIYNLPIHSLTNIVHFFSGGTFYYGDGSNLNLTGAYYRPMMSTTYSFLYAIFKLNSWGYHLFQIALAIAGTYILYLVLRYWFSSPISLVLAIIHLVHPLDSQAVFAIPSMQEVLYFFFGILALWIVTRYSSLRSTACACALLLLSLLSKETGMLFVLVTIWFLFLYNRQRIKPFLAMLVPFLAVYGLLYYNARALIASPHSAPIHDVSLGVRLLTAPSTMVFYFAKIIWPVHLATAYYWIVPKLTFTGVIVPLAIDLVFVAATLAIGYHLHKSRPQAVFQAYAFFWVWMMLGIALTLNIYPLDMTACETWFYFAIVGLLGIVAVTVKSFWPKKSPRLTIMGEVAVAVIVVVLMGLTAVRGVDYHSVTGLELHDINASPTDFVADDRLAVHYADDDDLDVALKFAQASVRIYPGNTNIGDLAYIQTLRGNYQGAIQSYKTSFKYGITPTILDDAVQVNVMYGNPTYAGKLLEQALALYKKDPYLWEAQAVYYAKIHDTKRASAAIDLAAKYGSEDPTTVDEIHLGIPFAITFFGKTFFIS